MSRSSSGAGSPGSRGAGGAGAEGGSPPACVRGRSPRPPFVLRFGRSPVAAHRPRALPCTVTDKFYARSLPCDDEETLAREQFAEQRVRRLFADQPSDKYHQPLTTQHEYGWYLKEDVIVNLMQWQRTDPACRLMRHPIRERLNKK